MPACSGDGLARPVRPTPSVVVAWKAAGRAVGVVGSEDVLRVVEAALPHRQAPAADAVREVVAHLLEFANARLEQWLPAGRDAAPLTAGRSGDAACAITLRAGWN